MMKHVRVVYDRKKVSTEKGTGKIELSVYLQKGERKWITVGEASPKEWMAIAESNTIKSKVTHYEEVIKEKVTHEYVKAFPQLEGKFSVHFCHSENGVSLGR